MTLKQWPTSFRHRLADANSLLHLSVLGVVSGCSCALVVLLFRYLIEQPSALWLPGNNAENFEALPGWLHFALPVAGAILLGLAMHWLKPAEQRIGIVHVLDRLHNHHGRLPLKNALLQFFGGAWAVATGQSAGREGPAIHLGAAANSLLGQKLALPNNSIRMLVACGTAAAIAASFDTPIAGVIFAMEVIMMEYTVAGFIPVMLSATTATIMSRAIYGSALLFPIPEISAVSLWEMPFILLLGLLVGCGATLFIGILKVSLRFSQQPVLARMTAAGLVTGCLAVLVPEIMGLGYDSLKNALADSVSLQLLMMLIAAKIIATAISAGLGMPIGLIGPNLLIGTCIGCAIGKLGAIMMPELANQVGFYGLLGMGAMMGAVLNAPLAGLMAVLELSNNTAVIFPAMLAITVATLTNRELFKQRSAHQTVFRHLNVALPTDPVSLALQRTSVASVMQTQFIGSQQQLSIDELKNLASQQARWVLSSGADRFLIDGSILGEDIQKELGSLSDDSPADLLKIATSAQAIVDVSVQATLKEALNTMDEHEVDALYVIGYGFHPQTIGIVLRSDIVSYYQRPQDD